MGCIEKQHLTNGIMSGNPSKKIRLDFQNKGDGNAPNEDLWGQDDLTAEEFDMLEIQATQICNQNFSYQIQDNNNIWNQQNVSEVKDLKQLQYELEGRVKLLSQSLEKSLKELNEERLHRQQMINDRMKEYRERETNLQKEVEKMQSILEFKDQEMKSTYSKLQVMKFQLQERKNNDIEMSVNKNFEDFLNSSKAGSHEDSGKLNISKKFPRRHKLIIDTPKGQTESIDILSSILCTRLVTPSFPSSENIINCTHLEDSPSSFNFTSVSVVQLKNEQKSDELLEFYKCFLKNHVTQLRAAASKSNTNCNKILLIETKRKETVCWTVISYICDIACLLSYPNSNAFIKKYYEKENPSISNVETVKIQRVEGKPSSSRDPLPNEDKENTSICTLSIILESLLALTDPKTYPIGYPKNQEIEFSLSALLMICLSCPERFMDLGFELPIYSLLDPHQSVTALCTTLKLLSALCSYKNFVSHIIHKNSNCILCLIATFLIDVVPYYPKKFSFSLILAEDFLSSIFSIHDIKETQLQTSQCISKVIQGIIKSVWKFYEVKEKNKQSIQIIKKGCILLHVISTYIPNFKERRNSAEDEYISLITGVLTLSKENIEFREFFDLIQCLWDFQTDTSEFDLDELCEETQASTNEINIVE